MLERKAGLTTLLNQEMDNADNARTLDGRSKIMIYLKIRKDDSYDVSKPAEAWEWRTGTR
jgi:hypothetical protein